VERVCAAEGSDTLLFSGAGLQHRRGGIARGKSAIHQRQLR